MHKVRKLEKQIENIEIEIAMIDDKIKQYKELEMRKEISKAEYNRHKARLSERIRAKRGVIKRKNKARIQRLKMLEEKEEKKKKKLEEKMKKKEKV